MARQTGSRTGGEGGGSSKFRLIVLDADLASGDLSQIASAITNVIAPCNSTAAAASPTSATPRGPRAEWHPVDRDGCGHDGGGR